MKPCSRVTMAFVYNKHSLHYETDITMTYHNEGFQSNLFKSTSKKKKKKILNIV